MRPSTALQDELPLTIIASPVAMAMVDRLFEFGIGKGGNLGLQLKYSIGVQFEQAWISRSCKSGGRCKLYMDMKQVKIE